MPRAVLHDEGRAGHRARPCHGVRHGAAAQRGASRSTASSGREPRCGSSFRVASFALSRPTASGELPALRVSGCDSVVDDDPLLIKSLRDILEGDGHVVPRRTAARAGIDAFAAGPCNAAAVRRRDHRSRHAVRGRPQSGRSGRRPRPSTPRSFCSPAGASGCWPRMTCRPMWTAC